MHPTKTRLDRNEQRQHSAMILKAVIMFRPILTFKWRLIKSNKIRQKVNMPNRDSMQELPLVAIFWDKKIFHDNCTFHRNQIRFMFMVFSGL